MNKKPFFVFSILVVLLGLPVLSACASGGSALSGGAGLDGAVTATITASPTSDATSTPVPTDTPVPTPTLGVGSTFISGDMTMMYVPAGDFTMGGSADNAVAECQKYSSKCEREWFSDEEPSHAVYLDAFWIDQTEVTNAMYAKCVEAGACQLPAYINSFTHPDYYGNSEFGDYPVIYVNWDAANAYCSWAGRRLPTEAEWEKAARGSDARTFAWGEDISCDRANYYDYYNGDHYCVGDVSKVRSYESGKSVYGAYDMTGNVWEWVNDWYDPAYYQSSPASNPLGADSSSYRTLRGGSWNSYIHEIRSTERIGVPPFFINHYIGFRCAVSNP